MTTPLTAAELQHCDPGLLTIPAAAAILGLSETTVRVAIQRGEIQTVQLVGRRYITRAELLALLGLPDLLPVPA